MKQTAIEWLENEFQEMCKDFGGVHSDFIVKFNQAKSMEKEQMILIYKAAFQDGFNGELFEFEQYYNETFKHD